MRTCRECRHDEGSGTDATFCGVIRSLVNGNDNRDNCRAFVPKDTPTIPVRIAVAVSENGHVSGFALKNSYGDVSDADLEKAVRGIRGDKDGTMCITMVSAHVPVPQPQKAGETVGVVQS